MFKEPKSFIYYIRHGASYYRKGHYDMAIFMFTLALKQYPEMPDIYEHRGKAYVGIKQYDMAITDYTKAMEIVKKELEATKSQNEDRSFKNRLKIAKFEVRLIAIFSDRANTYVKIGQNDKALADYNEMIELNPEGGKAYAYRSIAYHNLKKFKEAWSDIQKAESLGYRVDNKYVEKVRKAAGIK